MPGIRVLVADKLMGEELYHISDPVEYEKWLGKEVTIKKIVNTGEYWSILIEEDENISFLMEEIKNIVFETEMEESDVPISILLGGTE